MQNSGQESQGDTTGKKHTENLKVIDNVLFPTLGKSLMFTLKYIWDIVYKSFTLKRKILSTNHLINSLNKRKNKLQISQFLISKASK